MSSYYLCAKCGKIRIKKEEKPPVVKKGDTISHSDCVDCFIKREKGNMGSELLKTIVDDSLRELEEQHEEWVTPAEGSEIVADGQRPDFR
jgi:hypothetical protein